MRITFRKLKGRRYCGDPESFIVMVNGVESARIQSIRGGWFWYGQPGGVRINTAGTPKTLDECKTEVKQAFKGTTK